MQISLNTQKVICFLEFVEVAYEMYVPGVTNPKQPSNFPKGWRLVKSINAEAVVGFFRQKEFIGFIAQSIDEPSKFIVAMHGTEGVADFLDDFEFLMTDFNLIPNGGKTEYGFTRFYESLSFVDPLSGVSQNLGDYLKELNQNASYTVVGFSLGGALATLHAVVLASCDIPVEAYLFASPMVGNTAFVNVYNSLVSKSYRIVNKPDVVPQLPGTWLGYEHVNTLFEINSLNYPEIKRTISCFHSPEVYLYALGATNVNLSSCSVIR